jgi:uncharacterized protein (DUF2267 family)
LHHPDKDSAGPMGIKKIFVDDVNRIIGYKRYTYTDRYNRDKAFAMTRTYLRYYMKDEVSIEKAFAVFRAGNDGSKHLTVKQQEYVNHGILVYEQIKKGTPLCKLK